MQIRKLSHQEIETGIEFLHAMLAEMASFGGHNLHGPDSVSNYFRDRIHSKIDSLDHLFLGATANFSSSQLIAVLEASIANLHPVFAPKSLYISMRSTLFLNIAVLELRAH